MNGVDGHASLRLGYVKPKLIVRFRKDNAWLMIFFGGHLGKRGPDKRRDQEWPEVPHLPSLNLLKPLIRTYNPLCCAAGETTTPTLHGVVFDKKENGLCRRAKHLDDSASTVAGLLPAHAA